MPSSDNPYIAQALTNQDLERVKFSQNLRQNPDDYNKYVQSRIDSISDEIFNRKRTAFQKTHIDLARYMDMDHNANFYKTRSSDVDRLMNGISSNNQRIKDEIARDKDISKRQFEINEWYNYNKLETLFFLQIFFISILTMVVVMYLQKKGMITGQMAALITGVLCVIVGIIGIYRYSYTKKTRDSRLWHRRSFGKVTPVKESKCVGGGKEKKGFTIDLNDFIPAPITQCVDQIMTEPSTLETDILGYQSGSKSSKCSWSANKICDALTN